jgi:biotin synthase-like enzyme
MKWDQLAEQILAGRGLSRGEALAVLTSADELVAGGREACLGAMQSLALFTVNTIFTQGYLTTPRQGASKDLAMLAEAGSEVGQIEG